MKTQPWILDFEAAAKSGTAVVGGKGYHLGLLVRYGLPVPEGFVLSTQALEQVLLSNLAITMPAAAASSEELRQFQAAFAALPFPEDIRVELVRALEQRGWSNTAFAVRSSAPMEDSNVASFAGIHDSVLDVVGIDALISAIKTVWVSLWSPQAVSYRQRLGISQAGMAVVVMPMVRAVSAGVAFSCDPVSGRYDRITINAVRGLADSLVSGQVQGEDITFESGTFSDRYQLVQRQGPHCGLDDGQLETLAALIQDTAFALDYASPWYDIEWVWDGEQFFLVQARPITSRPLHTYEGLRGTSSLWSNSNTRDVIPHPMRAGEWALARHMASAMLAPTWQLIRYSTLPGLQRASLFNGRLYLSTALIQWEAFDAFGVRPSEINSLLGGHQPEIRTPEPKLTDRVQRGLRLLRFIAKSAPLRRLGHEQIHQAYATCKRWRQEDLSSLSDQALIDRFEMVMNHTCEQQGLFFMQAASAGSLPMLIKLLERYIPGQGHSTAAALLSGGEPSVTALQAYRLQTLAVQAASEPSTLEFLRTGNEDWQSLDSNSIFRQQFADFLDEFGHRAIYESYLHQPRWREKPGYLLENIVALLDHDELNHRQRLQNTRQEAGEILKRKLPLWARRWAQVLAQKSTSESNDREAARSALTRFTEIGRLCLLEVGRRLCMRGHLQQVQQVFHLTPWEFAAALRDSLKSDAVQHRVHARQQLLEFWEKHPAPDVIGEAPQMQPIKVSSAHSAGSQWQGTPVGAGVASGMARIIRNPEDGMLLQPGEILIAPSTDPSWTPMFLKASAIVMETGGYLSHGAIVAREFGIPAVVNIPGILNALTDGDELEVNGSAGKVSRSS